MRTLDLIKALSDAEIKTVEKSLSGGKRETLLKLFKELTKHKARKDEPTHEELFEKVMKESYAKDKDYLLRNRMRQLNEIIYRYLAVDAFEKNIDSTPDTYNYWLARAYYDRRMKTLFESDIDSFLADAQKTLATSTFSPSYSLNLFSLKSLWALNNQPRVPESVEKQLSMTAEWMGEEKRRFLHKVREIEAREAFLQMLLLHTKDIHNIENDTPGISTIDLQALEHDDWFARYLLLKRRLYQTKSHNKIAVLKEMLEIGAAPERIAILGKNDRPTNISNLAVELILTGQYKEANEYLTGLLHLCKAENIPVPIAALQNHMVNQINLGKYDEGVSIYKKYHKEITESRSANAITLEYCYLLFFAGKSNDVISRLPEASALTRQHQIHHRYAYLISFILRDDYDLALTETVNLKRLIKREKGKDSNDQLSIISFFEKYIKALGYRKPEKAKALSELKQKIHTQSKKWDLLAAKELPLRWLMVQLGE